MYVIYNTLYIIYSLYWRLPEDGDLSLKPVGGFKLMYNVYFCYVHVFVCIDD
jgi:hypothetical protein